MVLSTAVGDARAGPNATPPERAPLDLTLDDSRRLRAYARSLVDFHLVLDLLPALARAYALGDTFPSDVVLSPLQRVLLVAMGLQHKSVEDAERELGLPAQQLLAFFNKAVRRLSQVLDTGEAAGGGDAGEEDGRGRDSPFPANVVENQVVSVRRQSGRPSSAAPHADRFAHRGKKHRRG